jgi:twitching motility protein PilT
VGRDTPSFEQGLLDALREDIDVLLVGELRERETMRLTLDACETGHLVLATLHSGSVVDALQRLIASFPSDEQPAVCNRLADVLRGVVAQTLVWRDPPGGRVPECEILVANHAVRSILRQNQLFKLVSAMEIGVRDGMSTRERYRRWLDKREVWSSPFSGGPAASERGGHASAASFAAPETRPAAAPGRPATPRGAPTDGPAARVASEPPTPTEPGASDEVIVIEPVDESLADIVSELEKD